MRSVQFTCVYLATKIVDRMPYLELLRYILSRLYGSVVSRQQAADVGHGWAWKAWRFWCWLALRWVVVFVGRGRPYVTSACKLRRCAPGHSRTTSCCWLVLRCGQYIKYGAAARLSGLTTPHSWTAGTQPPSASCTLCARSQLCPLHTP